MHRWNEFKYVIGGQQIDFGVFYLTCFRIIPLEIAKCCQIGGLMAFCYLKGYIAMDSKFSLMEKFTDALF